MEGYLQIWHGFFKRWEKCYFRIHEEMLMFGPTKEIIENKVHLKIAQIITTIDDPVSFIIHTGTQTLRLRAYSIQERVVWFKKLRAIQKEVEQSNYIKQISSIDNKNAKIKALQQITIQLWQCHADLENMIDEITQRVKSSPLKSMIDKIRIIVQEIKLKNSSALKILEGHIIQNSRKKTIAQDFEDIYGHRNYSETSDYLMEGNGSEQTKFLSFMDNNASPQKNQNTKKIFKQSSKLKHVNSSYSEAPSLHNFSNRQNQIYPPLQKRKSSHMLTSMKTPTKNKYMVEDSSSVQVYDTHTKGNLGHLLKQKILNQNQAFVELRSNLPKSYYRSSLPEKFVPEEKFSFFQTFKGVGLDITRFSFPVTINEPLSMLQKGCQRMYYSKLLDQANIHSLPEFRMLYVCAFIVSQYSLSQNRFKKPSNPLWGQTFEFIDEQRQFQFLSEQVSHHPPISALHVRSNNYQFIDDSRSKVSFTGTSIRFNPQSKGRVILQKNKDEYIFSKCVTNINGLMSKMYVENSGKVQIYCKKFDTKAVIIFRENSFWSRENSCAIEGKIFLGEEEIYGLKGKWNNYLSAMEYRTSKNFKLWNISHQIYNDYYNFNEYTLQLNHLNENLFDTIPPTDSRLRPDQRALQYRKMELAGSQKNRLEEKQRGRRKQNEEKKKEHEVLWFQKVTDEEGNQYYRSNDLYWVERRRGNWNECLDIY